ncbi:MAG TPA: hypothetical protein VH391_11115 [Solirubrobacterales bacterium]
MLARRLAAVFALAAASALAGWIGLSAHALSSGKGAKAAPVELHVVTVSQRSLIATNHVRLSISSSRARTVRLSVLATTYGGANTLIASGSSTLHQDDQVVALPLNQRGRDAVADCGTASLQAKLALPGGHGVVKASAPIRHDVNRCRPNLSRVDLSHAHRCDFIAAKGSECLFPWPNDYYTKRDPTTDTGRRVDVREASTPTNAQGVHVDPAEIDTSDGFSPGAMIVLRVPGLDNPAAFRQTAAVPVTDMARSFDRNQPIVLIDAQTGKRQLIWSELDSLASSPDQTDLIIRPGKNLKEGHRYIVAMRNLKYAGGNRIPAPQGFRLYRDRIHTNLQAIEQRRAHFEGIFATLKKAGIARDDLYLAWDFTVASERNISERMLSIRNDAFSQLGDDDLSDGQVEGQAPQFDVTDVHDLTPSDSHGTENVREVTGTYEVPCYLNQPGCPSGSRFDLGPNGLPERIPGNTMTARFTCNIPRSAVQDDGSGGLEVAHQVRPSLYGHGLFGDFGEVHTQNVRQLGNDNGVMTCATDFIGMAEEDVGPEAIPALQDLSKFPALPDRLQQGFLNFMYLGRLMIHPDGFASDPAFRFDGQSVIDTDALFYYGNSQGGIAGGALTALSPDFTRSVLYVPGMNYSTLLTRSIDFADYALILYPSYPVEGERPLLMSMLQMMWDRGEPDGYANHMTTDPLPDTPAHKVLIEMAYGDHQVANVATEVEARTIGAPLRRPALDVGRIPNAEASNFYAIPTLGPLSGPAADGSGMFVWDIGPKRVEGSEIKGTDPPPTTNASPDDSFGVDPHDTVIDDSPLIRAQIANFIKVNGKITNPCADHPCYAAGWNGMP